MRSAVVQIPGSSGMLIKEDANQENKVPRRAEDSARGERQNRAFRGS